MNNLIKRLRKAAKFGGHYAEAADRIEELEARLEWMDNNTMFYDVDHNLIDGTDTPPNVPVLASVSKRIWYHATDDTESYPFSKVLEALGEKE
jgi:hypothetical protein